MNKLKLFISLFAIVALMHSCMNADLADTNMTVPDNNWVYSKSVKTSIDVKEINKDYQIFFKLRHTTEYRYSNIYVILRLKGTGLNKATRYQFKVANASGEWRGKGSGDLYSYTFPLLKNYRFTKSGKYTLEIEQNMRDNPLVGISDVGILVTSGDR